MSGKVTLKARTVGADRLSRRFLDFSQRQLPILTEEALRQIGEAAEVVFQSWAPVRSGRLIRGIHSQSAGGTVIVRADAKNPASGYDYVGVTRFGHRSLRIYPHHFRAPASVLATGKRRGGPAHRPGPGALRFTVGGKVLYRTSVAGYHPASDWAEDALPEVQREAERVASETGRVIEGMLG